MKTLAVIKNELFKDYLKIVSTDDLEATLDNPNVPMPFECLVSVDNSNSDALAEQLASYFQQQKLRNKDFFIFDEAQLAQLYFMMNLVKLSSGQSVSNNQLSSVAPVTTHTTNNTSTNVEGNGETNKAENSQLVAKVEEPEIKRDEVQQVEQAPSQPMPMAPVIDVVAQKEVKQEPSQQQVETVVDSAPTTNNTNAIEEPVVTAEVKAEPSQETVKVENKEPQNMEEKVEKVEELDDPFQLDEKEVVTPVAENKAEEINVFGEGVDEFDPFKIDPIVEEVNNSVDSSNVIEAYNVPKNATVHFSKNASITAQLADENNVVYEGNLLSLNDAARAAFKKAGTLGMPNGLINWLYEGKTLKDLKDGK